MIHFRHYFHAAGHGTFFSGQIRDDQNGPDFVWVYDCGSSRPSHLRGLIEKFVGPGGDLDIRWKRKHQSPLIDLLCLSHFDCDHVNGLDLLLRECRVDTLVLPYQHLASRLHAIATMNEEDVPRAGEVAALTLDPIHYLEQRDYGGRIGRIVLMQGRGGEPMEGGVPGNSELSSDAPPLSTSRVGTLESAGQDYASRAEGLASRTEVHSHRGAWVAKGIYEFVFYNTDWPDLRAPASRASLAAVAKEIETLIDNFELARPTIPRHGWLDAVRNLYGEHFGHSAPRRNQISLCVYGNVMAPRADHCEIFKGLSNAKALALHPTAHHSTGVLLTGDIALVRAELGELKRHVSDRRWARVGMMQIPHHGSRNNWRPGNSVECQHEYSVICAPGGDRRHPHPSVWQDLVHPVLADYDHSVAFDYHVDWR